MISSFETRFGEDLVRDLDVSDIRQYIKENGEIIVSDPLDEQKEEHVGIVIGCPRKEIDDAFDHPHAVGRKQLIE
jgi:hypothetical protein